MQLHSPRFARHFSRCAILWLALAAAGAALADTSKISPDRPLRATLDYTAAAVNAPLAWSSGLDGAGVGIAIIDSGIYSHPDLTGANGGSRVVYRQSLIGGVQYDDFGHG